jgi:predicted  nucleic acid-binding Zn-ribbon protein
MQKELAIFRQESGTGDTRELLSDIARLESQNATLKNELKELENKNFQENKQKEKDQQKLDKIEKDMLKYKRDVRETLKKVFY